MARVSNGPHDGPGETLAGSREVATGNLSTDVDGKATGI